MRYAFTAKGAGYEVRARILDALKNGVSDSSLVAPLRAIDGVVGDMLDIFGPEVVLLVSFNGYTDWDKDTASISMEITVEPLNEQQHSWMIKK